MRRATHAGRSALPASLERLASDRFAMAGLAVVAIFATVALGVWLGLWGREWSAARGALWQGPSAEHWLGTNRLGQDILARALAATATAFEIGLTVALAATALGAVLGALAGDRAGGPVDAIVLWLAGIFDAIPFYLFVAAVAVAFKGWPWAMHVAMIAAFWTTTARLVRAEILRLKEFEFVEAARALGLARTTILARHLLPNTAAVLLVQATLTFVGAIKTEVILSFLGLAAADTISWGMMIAESTGEVLAGHYMNFIVASGLLFALVTGFNLLADGVQDALDPRKGTHR